MDFYVYIHRRKSDGQIFYVGKGKGKRAHSHRDRNRYWHHVVAKHGYTVEIWSYWENESDAFAEEKRLIKFYKELYLPLTNLTDGGDGVSGLTPSEETRKKLSTAITGKIRSGETRRKMSESKKGCTFSEEHKRKLSVARKRWGRLVTVIFQDESQKTFNSHSDAAKFFNVGRPTIWTWIMGTRSPSPERNIKQIINMHKGKQ